ncbi:MAG: class III extradiol dioxygenase subunit B-like domain-containing protein [Candidatus Magasanikbacteria bacterium]|jgi:AmmeMemoRadiSam system protein B
MSLVFAAITPHPPLLIPSIGKDIIKKLDKTKTAMEKMEEELYLSKPDIIIIISAHGSYFSDAFTINVSPEYHTDLKEFGDITTKLNFKGEMNLSSEIRERTKEQKISTTMITEPTLDHGSAVPLFYLSQHLPDVKIIQMGFCDLDWKTHLDFGYLIKEKILDTNKRVAVIASGDLSHALTTDSPAGFNPAGIKFDIKIQELLANKNIAGMLQLEPNLVKEASECGFRTFLILMGVLQDINYTYRQHSYEAPFGVGYLTANFII